MSFLVDLDYVSPMEQYIFVLSFFNIVNLIILSKNKAFSIGDQLLKLSIHFLISSDSFVAKKEKKWTISL